MFGYDTPPLSLAIDEPNARCCSIQIVPLQGQLLFFYFVGNGNSIGKSFFDELERAEFREFLNTNQTLQSIGWAGPSQERITNSASENSTVTVGIIVQCVEGQLQDHIEREALALFLAMYSRRGSSSRNR